MGVSGSSICGWELNHLDKDNFDIQVVEVFGSCRNCEAVNECTTPCESLRRLAPKKGRLIELGSEHPLGGPAMTYFALLRSDEVRFILLREPEYYWASASYIAQEFVPAWALSQLSRRA